MILQYLCTKQFKNRYIYYDSVSFVYSEFCMNNFCWGINYLYLYLMDVAQNVMIN